MQDRRRHARFPDQRPAKLRRSHDQRYLPAETVDRSAGGALLKLGFPSNVQPGQRVELALPRASEAVLSAAEMQPARVVRRLGKQAETYIAIAFEQPAAPALAAAS